MGQISPVDGLTPIQPFACMPFTQSQYHNHLLTIVSDPRLIHRLRINTNTLLNIYLHCCSWRRNLTFQDSYQRSDWRACTPHPVSFCVQYVEVHVVYCMLSQCTHSFLALISWTERWLKGTRVRDAESIRLILRRWSRSPAWSKGGQ